MVDLETHFAEHLRLRCQMYMCAVTPEQLTEQLELLPSGVAILLERDAWPLSTGLRVADKLGLEVTLRIRDPQGR